MPVNPNKEGEASLPVSVAVKEAWPLYLSQSCGSKINTRFFCILNVLRFLKTGYRHH